MMTIAITVVVFVFLVVAGVGLLNMPSVQNKFLTYATEMLQEKLQTKVEIDSIRIGFFKDDVRLYNLKVEDRQQRPMLQLEQLGAEIKLWALLNSEVQLEEVTVRGLHAQLFKEKTDSVANYQFVLDAFKPSKKKKKEEPKDKEQSGKSKKLTVDLDKLLVEDVDVVYNESRFAIGSINIQKGWGGKMRGGIHQVEASWVRIKKKDSTHVDNRLLIDEIRCSEESDKFVISVDSIHLTTDNHLPHKRTGKPKRGWFDDGHLKVVAHLRAELTHADKDSVCGILKECDVNDKASGFHITDLHLRFKQQAGKVYVSKATVCMKNTTLKFDKGEIQLPSKKQGRPFLFSTSTITGTTLLTDISKPFAPVLKDFKLPLWLSTNFRGTDSTLVFSNVLVKTTDNKLQIKADGGIEGLKDKYKLNVHFKVHDMHTPVGTVERIINQFPVKKFMMKQLRALGTLRYNGSFKVVWKREEFQGNISTNCGRMQFWFALDEKNKYLHGNVQSNAFELGKAMDYPELGRIVCRAGFKMDISKERTAVMRRQKGGKLPIGQIDAIVYEATYKDVMVTDVYANIVSDGAVAEGKLKMKGKLADLLCSFSFTDTNEMKKTKIKPGIRFHLFNHDNEKDDDKAEREKRKAERKEYKRQEREAKKQQRAAEKEQRAAEKEARKAQKKAEKEARKAQKKAEKEARKAQKAAEKGM